MIDDDGTVANEVDSEEYEDENSGLILEASAALRELVDFDDVELEQFSSSVVGKFDVLRKHMEEVLEEDPTVKGVSGTILLICTSTIKPFFFF